MSLDLSAKGGLAVTGIALMQLGENGGASRRRFPRVAFEGGFSFDSSESDHSVKFRVGMEKVQVLQRA